VRVRRMSESEVEEDEMDEGLFTSTFLPTVVLTPPPTYLRPRSFMEVFPFSRFFHQTFFLIGNNVSDNVLFDIIF
jgi:hypothetical protein